MKRRIIKTRIFSLIFSILFIVSFFMNLKANAQDIPFKLESINIINKSETVTGDITYSDNDEVKNNVVFHKVNDNITYKLIIKNNLGKNVKISSITDNNDNDYIIYEYDKHENIEVKNNESFELIIKATYKKELTDITKREQASNVKITINYLDEGEEKGKSIIINPTTGDKINGSFIMLIISSTGLIVCLVLDKKRKNKKISTFIIILLITPIFVKSATFKFNIEFTSDFKLYDKQLISYIVNGKEKNVVVPYNETILELEEPIKKGYSFKKWTNEDGTDFDKTKPITKDTKIIPVFEIDHYEIEYDLDGGVVLPINPTTYTIENKITLNNPVKPHYDFSGWTGTGLSTSTKTVVIENMTGNRSYKANYTPTVYTISYSGLSDEEKNVINNPTSYNIKSETFTLTNPENRTDEYGNPTEKFVGWNDGTTTLNNISLPVVDTMGNKEYEAVWEEADPATYTIDYNLNGGTVSSNPTSYTNKTETFTLNNPTKEGYTFKGWSGTTLDGDENKTVTITKGTRKNFTFTAHFVANTYTVKFDKNGENVSGTMNNQSFTYDQSGKLNENNYSKEGYTFAGWNTKANGEGVNYSDKEDILNIISEGSITLYAKWNANEYEIQFIGNHNNVGVEMSNFSMTYDTPKALPNNLFIVPGYSFVEWNTKADGSGDSYTNGQTVNNLATTGTIKLYAMWSPVQATITFDKNSENATGIMNNQTITYDVQSNLNSLGFARVGYTFTKWNTREDGMGTSYDDKEDVTNKFTENTTLYARWQANDYIVEYNANNEKVEGEMSNQPMIYDTPDYLSQNLFSLTGYTFNEWNTKADGSGNSYADEELVNNLVTTGTVKLYAMWVPNNYTIEFIANNENVEGVMNSLVMTYDTAKSLTNNTYTLTGYEFIGWNTEADGSGDSYTDGELVNNLVTTGTVKLYAMWVPNNYTIEFIANNENVEGVMNSLAMTYDTAKSLTNNAYTLTGYEFIGWNTEADGSGDSYTDGQSVNNLVTTGTVKLYAMWSPKKIVITFDKNHKDAVGTMNNQTVTYDVETTLDEVGYTRDEYIFTGWNTKANGSGNSYLNKANITNVFTENTTLYAQWSTSKYMVSFDTDEGEAIDPIGVNVGSQIGELPTPIKQNYIFKGWYVNISDENPIDSTYVPNDNITLHAKWDMILCKKATVLNTEVCNQTDANKFCSGAGHSNKGTITYGNIIDSDSYEAGDAFDCNVNGSGYNQRFYYLRTVDNKAILISNKNYTAASGQDDQNSSFIYSQAHAQLPNASVWNTLPVTFDEKAARLITMEDILDFTGAESASNLSATGSLDGYEFLFENSNYSGIGERSTQWLKEVSSTSRYRYRNDQRNLAAVESGKLNSSTNPVRPVIEIPLNLIEDDYIINYDPNGGTISNEYVRVKKGSKLNSLPTPEREGYMFDGWYTTLFYTKKVNENTIPDGYKTYYAKWNVSVENADLLVDNYHLEIGETANIIIENILELEPITFSSNNPSVASVDSDGVITALSEGTTKIVITGQNTHETVEIDVIVAAEVNEFNVVFDVQGGEPVDSINVTKNTAIGELPTTEKAEYAFDGWYTNNKYTTKVTPSTIIDSNKTFYAKWVPADAVVEVNGSTYKSSIQTAIDEATTDKTTIRLLKDVQLDSIIDLYTKNTDKNIILDLNEHTLYSNTVQIIRTKATIEIKNGTIRCGTKNGAIDVGEKGHLIMNSGRVEHTATGSNGRAAIYNDGGTVELGGKVYLTAEADGSNAAKRATVQNIKGTMIITGGTIVSTRSSNSYAVSANAGTLIIGTKDDIYDTESLVLQANTNGIYSDVNYSLYDGMVKGKTAAVNDESKIINIEDNAENKKETDEDYNTLYYTLAETKYKITFDSNGGSVNPTSKSISVGSEVGELPIPERGVYTFDGWYSGNTLIDENTIPEGSTTYTAHWHYEASEDIKNFNMTNDVMTEYYNRIDTWKNDQSTFQAHMDENFNNYNCKCTENTCSTAGTELCDKPRGYETGVEDVKLYESNESTKVKGDEVSYVTIKDGTIYNMIPGKTYYWESASDSQVHGYVKASGNRRTLDTEGTRNVRDLGGLKVDTNNDGVIDGTLKYGKIFRGERLYSDNKNALAIKKLGVTEEIDLRASSEIPSTEVHLDNFKHREIKHYQLDFTTQRDYYDLTRAEVVEAMQDVIDGNNIYFHCRIGTDRTGTLAYILEGLLGVNQEEMLQDYELSYFYGLVNRHRYYSEDPKSSVSKTQKFVYMYNLMPNSQGVYNWFMQGSTNTAVDNKLINDFRQAMINYN